MKKYITIVICCSVFIATAQMDFKKLVPPNPQAASLIKPVLTPVTEYAGLPNIGIPLYTINEDNISLPISLSYQAGGILVSEEAGHVGLGWALNSGGIISRTINGNGDFGESPAGFKYLQTANPIPDYEEITFNSQTYFSPAHNSYLRADDQCNFDVNGNPTYFAPLTQSNTGQDYLPDMFHFNFNGYSGSFILKPNGEVFNLEKNGLIIDYQYVDGPYNFNYEFTFTTEDGTQYEFKQWEKTNTNIYDTSIIYTSSWYLTKIVTTNGRTIDFQYSLIGSGTPFSGNGIILPLKSFVQKLKVPGNQYESSSGPQTSVEDLYLNKISWSNGEIDFTYSLEGVRKDVPTAHYLEKIEVKNSQRTIKTYDFNYSYFGNENVTGGTLNGGDYFSEITYDAGANPDINLRLKLDSIVENGISVHSFDYFDSNNVPNKTTLSQDYWGFYNGAFNSISFIPELPDIQPYNVPGAAKRTPVESQTKLFSLKRVVYPTGGYSEYDYESNTYDPESIDYSFWESNYIPVPDNYQPLNTVELSEYSISNGGANWTVENFTPITSTDVTIRFDLAIYGSTLQKNSSTGLYPQGPINFQTDMNLILRNVSTNEVVWQQGFNSAQAALDFEQAGQAFFSVEIIRSLFSGDNYALEAYFDDHSGTYFGQAKITATWEAVEDASNATNPKQFAIGGGLRIKSISDFDSNGKVVQKRNFNYHYTELVNNVEVERSYGKVKTLPNYSLDSPYYQDYSGSATRLLATSSSVNPLSKDMGSYVGYSQVEMTFEDTSGNDNGKTISKYYNYQDYLASGNNLLLDFIDDFHKFPAIRIPHNGRMYEQSQLKRNSDGTYTIVSKTNNNYTINGIDASTMTFRDFIRTSDFVMSGVREWVNYWSNQYSENVLCANSLFHFRPIYSSRVELFENQKFVYDETETNPLVTTQQIFYDNQIHYMPTRTETTDSKGNVVTTQTWYPDDINQGSSIEGGSFINYAGINSLKSDALNPRIGQPIQQLSIANGSKTLSRTNFTDWGGGLILPVSSQSLKGDLSASNVLQTNVEVLSYDEFGNPLEFRTNGGPTVSYIWGYGKKYLIAKIENATYQEIAAALNITLSALQGYDETNITQIDALRNTSINAMVTTYTYDPLVGITSITDPRGYTMTYIYDNLNRLVEIRDDNGDKITDYQYHFKGQTN